jgi:integrase
MAESNNLGSIYTRPGSSRLWISYYHGGKQYRESCGSDRITVAKALLKKRQLETGQGRPAQASKSVTLKDLRLLQESSAKAKGNRSTKEMARAWGHLQDFFGEATKAAGINGIRLEEYKAQREAEGIKPSTIRNELAQLKAAFNIALKKAVLLRSELPTFPTITVKNAKKGFFTDAEMNAVKAHLSPDVADMLDFFFLTGWRSSEIKGLRWADVDLKAQSLRIDDTKSGLPRTLPFAVEPKLVALLEKRRAISDAVQKKRDMVVTHVFHRDGDPIKNFRTGWVTACCKAGLGKVERNEKGTIIKKTALRTPHDFRRTAARNFLRGGMKERNIMALCGWETRSVFDRYTITDEEMISEDLKKYVAKRDSLAQKENEATGTVTNIEAGRTDDARATA